MSYYIAKKEDLKNEFNENGFLCEEILAGTNDTGIRHYQCILKAGCKVSPELIADKTVTLMFGKGKGYITTDKAMHNITELSFYLPNFDKEAYTIYAIEDMEFIYSTIEMNEWDWKMFNEGHVRLPFFMKYSDGQVYDQDCKGPNTTSWMILGAEQVGRLMIGVVRAIGEGTVEKGHPAVDQWNYVVGDSEIEFSMDNQAPVIHRTGEFSFVPAGLDHSLTAAPGKECFYVWYEHFTRERDFKVCLLPDQKLADALKH